MVLIIIELLILMCKHVNSILILQLVKVKLILPTLYTVG